MSRRVGKKGANWSVERRYEFMEFRLYWQGHINRSDLMEAFGISVQQASKDFANYIEGRKSNLTYDKRLRTYLRGKNFKPRYFQPDAAEYFAQLQAVEHGLVPEAQSWISFFPGYAATPIPARGVDSKVLRDVLTAIREKVAIQITYQSMSKPEPTTRWIEPHALAFDGFRWHARAFCQNTCVFKDFLLSRIVAIGEQGDALSTAENDTDWHSEIVLEIGPHQELSDTQRRTIEMDYGMLDGKAEIVVRRALLFYALKRLGLDTDPAARKPQDQQIILLNQHQVNESAGKYPNE
jgi:predicted DNA-binding transcriptional regulator YafY